MKTHFLLLPLAALTLSAHAAPEAEAPAPSPATAAPTMQALGSLDDAECAAIESYLLRASSSALFAYADAFEAALKAEDRDSLVRFVQGGHASVLAAGMAREATDSLPDDFRLYLAAVWELMQQGQPRSGDEMKQMHRQRTETLKSLGERYPRPAACLPPDSLLLPLNEATRGMKNDIWTQRGSLEDYVAELREIAKALPRPVEAAEARRQLMGQALKPFDSIQASMVSFEVGHTQSFSFPAAAGLPYRWQLAAELPADAPVSVSWSEGPACFREPGSPELEREASVKGLREGTVTLHFVFTRPGDTEPLFRRECTVEVRPEGAYRQAASADEHSPAPLFALTAAGARSIMQLCVKNSPSPCPSASSPPPSPLPRRRRPHPSSSRPLPS